MNKTQGVKAAEWYRNNPTKPHTSNPFVNVNDAKWFPQASVEDPQKQNLASTVDPYRSETQTTTAPGANAQPFEDYMSSLYEKASAQYEEKKKGYPSLPSEVASASRGADIFYDPNYGEYGGYTSRVNPDKEQVTRIQKWMSEGEDKNPDSPLYGQNLSNLIRVQSGGWHVGAATASDPEPLQYGLENVGLERYRAPRKNEAISKIAESIYSKESGGKTFEDLLNDQQAPSLTSDYEVAAEYGGGAWKKEPQWLKDIQSEYNKVKGKPSSPGTPKVRGMGDTWNPARDAALPTDTDYSIATALSGSDEQRQQQTFQAEFDPQKAQMATAAAKAYKKSASTEDPFRSQAVFG